MVFLQIIQIICIKLPRTSDSNINTGVECDADAVGEVAKRVLTNISAPKRFSPVASLDYSSINTSIDELREIAARGYRFASDQGVFKLSLRRKFSRWTSNRSPRG